MMARRVAPSVLWPSVHNASSRATKNAPGVRGQRKLSGRNVAPGSFRRASDMV
jgi:hypothetical protein